MKPPNPREFVSDAAKKCADIVNGLVTAYPWDELKTKWVAIRLSDGGHDGTLYDTKRDAVRFQLDEFLCAYISFRNMPAGINPIEAERFLDWNRRAYKAGFRLPDPDAQHGGAELFPTIEQYDTLARINARKHFHALGAVDLKNLFR